MKTQSQSPRGVGWFMVFLAAIITFTLGQCSGRQEAEQSPGKSLFFPNNP